MHDIKQFLDDIEGDTQQHKGDIKTLELLLKVAVRCNSRAECGELWLATCDGDEQQAKRELGKIQQTLNKIMLGWYVGSVLKTREMEAFDGNKGT